MTRIFDALRKAQAARPAASPPPIVPIPPPAAHGPRAVPARAQEPAPRPSAPPVGVVPFPIPIPLPEEVVREMGALRVHLDAALADRSPRTLLLMSAQGGEGTTTVAAEFAAALARDGRMRVLLVDAHARRPVLSLEVAHARTRPAPPEGVLPRHLDFLPLAEAHRAAGMIPPGAAREAIEAVAGGYDWVIVDGPPALESSDAASLAVVADGVVVVVQAGRTKRPVLGRAVDLMRRAGGRVLGSVLNRRRLEIPEFIYRRI